VDVFVLLVLVPRLRLLPTESDAQTGHHQIIFEVFICIYPVTRPGGMLAWEAMTKTVTDVSILYHRQQHTRDIYTTRPSTPLAECIYHRRLKSTSNTQSQTRETIRQDGCKYTSTPLSIPP
jgi:hypothetical protein